MVCGFTASISTSHFYQSSEIPKFQIERHFPRNKESRTSDQQTGNADHRRTQRAAATTSQSKSTLFRTHRILPTQSELKLIRIGRSAAKFSRNFCHQRRPTASERARLSVLDGRHENRICAKKHKRAKKDCYKGLAGGRGGRL